ncbi:Hypothetical protein NTJ_01641 [Nesidiocoris tenuis]|uniref:Uncharacterized protein n=1 Tax=Nesidiocoris tenuis TaxID=355587 RepID=A0ABN7ABY1_9HEMI|nr:Hypothetical protein NTJ_01641 [Nesidiocoris tenuis]
MDDLSQVNAPESETKWPSSEPTFQHQPFSSLLRAAQKSFFFQRPPDLWNLPRSCSYDRLRSYKGDCPTLLTYTSISIH